MAGDTESTAPALKIQVENAEPKEAEGADAAPATADAIDVAVSTPVAATGTAAAHGTLRTPVAGQSAAVPENTCCGLKLSAPHTAGPWLKYWGLDRVDARNGGVSCDPRFRTLEGSAFDEKASITGPNAIPSPQYVWVGSLLIVTQVAKDDVKVKLQVGEHGSSQALESEELETFRGWTALRFKIRIPQPQQQTQVFYDVSVNGEALVPREGDRYSFFIMGHGEPAHWGFYSCSGFTSDVPAKKREEVYSGVPPMWQDVMAVHKQKPLHLLVGGGDQLYCDDVWTLPSLKAFLDLPHDTPAFRDDKRKADFTTAMREEVDGYYFHHYCCHFAMPVVSEVYARVPQVMTWDDHDIFDGWGSYPRYLQESEVFQGIFHSANRWYCIFQQHCRHLDKQPVSVYEVGSRTAIVTCDQRQRRRKHQILPLEHYMEFTELCRHLPKGIEHVVFVSTIPVVYPDIKGARAILHMLKTRVMKWIVMKMGGNSLINAFGEPELLDDLDDHWCAPKHHDERRFLVEHLQMLSKYRGCRVSLLSGDVHVCGAGYLVSDPEPSEEELRHDFRFMPQIISSAIGNPPPPGGLMKVMDIFGARGTVNKTTKHEMFKVIKTGLGVNKMLENRRNWCEVIECPLSDPKLAGYITFRLRVEESPGSALPPDTYDVAVPPLDPLVPGTDEYYDVHSRRRSCWWC